MDRNQLKQIQRRYTVEAPGDAWPKYLDVSRWMTVNLQRVRDLELDFGFRKRILDIGCGAGYFLHICQQLGHKVLGLDIDEVPMYGEMMQMLSLKRILWRVNAFEPLPVIGQRFDVITCFMICFNGHKSHARWRPPEWQFFLDDLARRLRPGGRIHLGLNRESDGTYVDKTLRRFFQARGAEISGGNVTIRPDKRSQTKLVTRAERGDFAIPAATTSLPPLLPKTKPATAGGSKR
jgi:2-polyprenyl-3-methyl-5-hydroxy-6-metoxy-1,4-benzoquinol methylase